MPGWLKAGLIGAVGLILLTLIGLVPGLVCITLPLTLLFYPAIGALAAAYVPPVRSAGQGAGQGTLAAVTAALLSGSVTMAIYMVHSALIDTSQAISELPPETLEALHILGIPPELLVGISGGAIGGFMCCSLGVLIAAALGAIGGALYGAVKPE
ncbi:MAG: hypothetical protein AB1894_08005 [Chloroflexota bacterium]